MIIFVSLLIGLVAVWIGLRVQRQSQDPTAKLMGRAAIVAGILLALLVPLVFALWETTPEDMRGSVASLSFV